MCWAPGCSQFLTVNAARGSAGIRTESGVFHSKLLFQLIKVPGISRLQGGLDPAGPLSAMCNDSRLKLARLAISGFSDSHYLQMTA